MLVNCTAARTSRTTRPRRVHGRARPRRRSPPHPAALRRHDTLRTAARNGRLAVRYGRGSRTGRVKVNGPATTQSPSVDGRARRRSSTSRSLIPRRLPGGPAAEVQRLRVDLGRRGPACRSGSGGRRGAGCGVGGGAGCRGDHGGFLRLSPIQVSSPVELQFRPATGAKNRRGRDFFAEPRSDSRSTVRHSRRTIRPNRSNSRARPGPQSDARHDPHVHRRRGPRDPGTEAHAAPGATGRRGARGALGGRRCRSTSRSPSSATWTTPT